jgi:hypothetical protein
MTDLAETDADVESLWTEDQTAAYVGLTKNSLYRHRVAGTGPAFVLVTPAKIRYRPSVVKAWVESREFSSMAAYYSSAPNRAAAADLQRKAASKARQTRWSKLSAAQDAEADRG